MIRFCRRLSFLLVGVLAMVAVSSPQAASAQGGEQCFNVPGISQCIRGRFLQYWTQNGGLAAFGYPITAEYQEQTPDGVFTVQYFQRNRFEYHPEKERPYDVLLGRLSDDLLRKQGRMWQLFPKAAPNASNFFGQTGHAVTHQPFWNYWSTHGLELGDPGISERESLSLIGLPISEAMVETNASGDTVITQWFERARLEDHGPRGVLLGLLGNETVSAAPPSSTPIQQPPASSPRPLPASPAPPSDPCAGIPAPRFAVVEPNCVRYGEELFVGVFGFEPNEEFSYWITLQGGGTLGGPRTVTADSNGEYGGKISTVAWRMPPGNYVFAAQDVRKAFEPSTAPFRVLPGTSAPPPSQPAPPPPPSQPAPPRPPAGQCHPSYPTVCIPPPPPDLDCGDIPYKRFRVLAPDPHGFDRDGDGIGCER